MELVAFVAALALVEYTVFATQCGRARARYGVKAPATAGHPIFERHYRIQHNTIEQLVTFLPSLFLFARYVRADVAAALGLLFVAGRAVYARGYLADPEKRGPGFAIGAIANALLLLGGLVGALWALVG
jgi:uncharacterized MAPEG superfamily protein